MSNTGHRWVLWAIVCVIATMGCAPSYAQTGDLLLAPDATVSVAATLSAPSGIAYDAAGDLYIADRRANIVRCIDANGVTTTVAGNGEQGYSGDGGPAVAAQLNAPMGLIVSPAGDLYIADSGNCRVRVVTNGIIHTFAGSGSCGSAGDGVAATASQLRRPVALALTAGNELLIADAGDHRVRRVAADQTIHPFAGTGHQGYAGDGGPAIDAEMDSPAGLAVDTSGDVYIADRLNHRIRMVDTSGLIHTIAGDGVARFRDGGLGSFANPRGVTVGADGVVYVADSGNRRIRAVTPDGTATVAGTGEQGSRIATGAARSITIDKVMAITNSGKGGFVFADQAGHTARDLIPAALSFAPTPSGSQSGAQSVTMTNSGTGPLVIRAVALPAGFLRDGGSCGTVPIALASGASCSVGIVFSPLAASVYSGAAQFSGDNFVARSIQLTGTGLASGVSSPAATTITLSTGGTVAYTTSPLVLSAHVNSAMGGIPTGNVQFLQDGNVLGSAALVQGSASWTIAAPSAGVHTFVATYSGDANFAGSTSPAVIETISVPPDFLLDATTGGSSPLQTVSAGGTAVIPFTVQPVNGSYVQTVAFSISGLPMGATASFDPPSCIPGASAQRILLTIKVPANASKTGLAILPVVLLAIWLRRRWRVAIAGLAVLGLVGCGGFRGASSGQTTSPTQRAYPLTITGTATLSGGGTVTHSTAVTLVVQSK